MTLKDRLIQLALPAVAGALTGSTLSKKNKVRNALLGGVTGLGVGALQNIQSDTKSNIVDHIKTETAPVAAKVIEKIVDPIKTETAPVAAKAVEKIPSSVKQQTTDFLAKAYKDVDSFKEKLITTPSKPYVVTPAAPIENTPTNAPVTEVPKWTDVKVDGSTGSPAALRENINRVLSSKNFADVPEFKHLSPEWRAYAQGLVETYYPTNKALGVEAVSRQLENQKDAINATPDVFNRVMDGDNKQFRSTSITKGVLPFSTVDVRNNPDMFDATRGKNPLQVARMGVSLAGPTESDTRTQLLKDVLPFVRDPNHKSISEKTPENAYNWLLQNPGKVNLKDKEKILKFLQQGLPAQANVNDDVQFSKFAEVAQEDKKKRSTLGRNLALGGLGVAGLGVLAKHLLSDTDTQNLQNFLSLPETAHKANNAEDYRNLMHQYVSKGHAAANADIAGLNPGEVMKTVRSLPGLGLINENWKWQGDSSGEHYKQFSDSELSAYKTLMQEGAGAGHQFTPKAKHLEYLQSIGAKSYPDKLHSLGGDAGYVLKSNEIVPAIQQAATALGVPVTQINPSTFVDELAGKNPELAQKFKNTEILAGLKARNNADQYNTTFGWLPEARNNLLPLGLGATAAGAVIQNHQDLKKEKNKNVTTTI